MNIQISGTNLKMTDGIKTHVEESFNKLTHKFPTIHRVNVILSLDGSLQKAEANLHFHGVDFNASASTDDLYASIDELQRKLDLQLTKHKEKISG